MLTDLLGPMPKDRSMMIQHLGQAGNDAIDHRVPVLPRRKADTTPDRSQDQHRQPGASSQQFQPRKRRRDAVRGQGVEIDRRIGR